MFTFLSNVPSSARISTLFPCNAITVKGPRKFASSLPPFLCSLLTFCLHTLSPILKPGFAAPCFFIVFSCCLVTLLCTISIISSKRFTSSETASSATTSSTLLSTCEQMFLHSFSLYFQHCIYQP